MRFQTKNRSFTGSSKGYLTSVDIYFLSVILKAKIRLKVPH